MAPLPQLLEEDIRVIDEVLCELLQKSEATAALVIDQGGFLITKAGMTHDFDTVTLAALAAASFAATQGLAGLVSETNFFSVYQQGENYSLLVHNVDNYCLLTVIFRATISVGAVKYYAKDIVKIVAAQLKIAREREPGKGLDLSMANLADPAPLFKRKQKAA
jgi:predicted regulator of Ras-like GTPase activity (Roadblock/LC7/MglB family)